MKKVMIFALGWHRRTEILYEALKQKEDYIILTSFTICHSVEKYKKKNLLLIIKEIFKAEVVYVAPMTHKIWLILLCKLLGKKLICDIYAGLYDSSVNDRKINSKKSVGARVHYYRDRLAMKYSDACLFLTEAEKKHFISSVSYKEEKVKSKVVPLAIDGRPTARLAYYNNRSECLNLCWTGSYIPLQGLDVIIRAMTVLKEKNVKVKLYIYGPTNGSELQYKELAEELKVEKYIEFVELWGDMSRWEYEITNKCDIALGIFGSSKKAKSVLANKVVDGVIFQMPTITAYSNGAESYFNGKTDIYFVENTPEALADKIIELSTKTYAEIKENTNRAYEIYLNEFKPELYVERMEKIIREIC